MRCVWMGWLQNNKTIFTTGFLVSDTKYDLCCWSPIIICGGRLLINTLGVLGGGGVIAGWFMKIGKHWLAHNLSYRVTLKIEQEKINIGGNIRGRQNSKKFFFVSFWNTHNGKPVGQKRRPSATNGLVLARLPLPRSIIHFGPALYRN